MMKNPMVTAAGSVVLESIVKLPALRAPIHKNAFGSPSGVGKMRLFAVTAALLTVNVFVPFAIVTDPAELPWTSTLPFTCSATSAAVLAVADTPIPLSLLPDRPWPESLATRPGRRRP